ncbi:MAG: type IV pilin protein [Thiotrichaceae bacterium]|nr:type IV pilin protein [Thiotrichaceae bacterium]
MSKIGQKNKHKGFTLIEVMIVVAIVGILVAIAYPNYSNHVMKSKRIEAMSELMHMAQLQEKFFSQNLKYAYDFEALYGTTASGASAGAAASGTTVDTDNQLYKISLVATMASSSACNLGSNCIGYTLKATANSTKQQSNDTTCNTFTIAHTGARTAKTLLAADSTNDCW